VWLSGEREGGDFRLAVTPNPQIGFRRRARGGRVILKVGNGDLAASCYWRRSG
jgi:hypothetical protein